MNFGAFVMIFERFLGAPEMTKKGVIDRNSDFEKFLWIYQKIFGADVGRFGMHQSVGNKSFDGATTNKPCREKSISGTKKTLFGRCPFYLFDLPGYQRGFYETQKFLRLRFNFLLDLSLPLLSEFRPK